MSISWSLPMLLSDLHSMVEADLRVARKSLAHPTDKGDASEVIWIDLLNKYLPTRYHALKAHVVDSRGNFSDQIDVVVRDRQYSPFLFTFKQTHIVPVESVYAAFEAKQELNAVNLRYAHTKVATVRGLYRTSLPVPTVEGVKQPKKLERIVGGILALSSSWAPAIGDALRAHVVAASDSERLDIGCVADAGYFTTSEAGACELISTTKSITHFLLELIARLQAVATVPMLDVRAYALSLPR